MTTTGTSCALNFLAGADRDAEEEETAEEEGVVAEEEEEGVDAALRQRGRSTGFSFPVSLPIGR
jgi:hypothetical protein